MKTVYSIVLVLLCTIKLQAQQLQARLGTEIKFPKSVAYDKIVGVSGDKIYALASSLLQKPIEGDRYAEFAVIDAKTMKVTSSTPIAVPDKKTALLETMVIKGQPWIFTRTSSRKESVDFIKAYKLNVNTGEVIPKEYPIAEFIDKKNFKLSTSQPEAASAFMFQSPDSSKVALVVFSNIESEEMRKYYVKILDANTMTPLWDQYITIPINKFQYKTSTTSITNQGSFQVIGKMYDTKNLDEAVSKTEAAYKYVLYEFDGTNTRGSDYILDLGGKFINNVTTSVRPDNGNRVIAGLYSDKKNIIANGLYYMEIDKNTGAVVNKYMTAIPSDKIRYAQKGILEKKENGLTYFATIDNIFFKKSGDFMFVIGTDYMITSRDQKNNTTTSYITTKGSVAVGLGKKGEMQWGTAIPRDYNSSFEDVAYIKTFFRNDCLFMIYNDSEDNAKAPLDEKIRHTHSNKKGGAVLVKIDGTGKINRRMLFSENTLDGHFIRTIDGVPTSSNEYLIAVRKYNLFKGTSNIKMCRITFTD